MLPPAMRPRAALLALLVLAAVALAGVAAGCGEEQTSEVAEGEPLELAGLDYAVQITRFLNPDDTEDSGYMVGQPPAKPGTSYLGVFLTIANPSDEALPSATEYKVVDTLDNEYTPVESTARTRSTSGPRCRPTARSPSWTRRRRWGLCRAPSSSSRYTTTSVTTAR